MITLLLWGCLIGGDHSCGWGMRVPGFVHERQCQEMSSQVLVKMWIKLNPDKKVVRWICTASPEYLVSGHKA